MVQPNESQSSVLGVADPLVVAVVAYAIVCVPAYLWLEGPVGNAGTVDGSVVIAALALGSILFVPIVKSVLERRTGRTGRFRTGGPWEGNE
ncbi:hypothetical protein [Halomarina pelagica]|uniref:hypothetical protein n=1 Tax=Halomarina pelagica TaxID=2961599 RepID=UPI0020C34415|nr:hypothetical protein [Halomarina sp. BND7]